MILEMRLSTESGQRRKPRAGLAVIGIAIALALVSAPAALFSNHQLIDWNSAHAGGKGGGGNGGGGNGGGGNGGGGNGGGGAGTGGGDNGPNADPASVEFDRGGGKNGAVLLPLEQGVALAQFTTKISKRYPADNVALHQAPHQAITFFTEVQGLAGRILTHRWIYQGRVQYQADFKIRGASWKSWSTQMLPVEKPGEWTVEIVDDSGTVLTTRSLDYEPIETATAEAGDG
jgi:hypothetical protein